MRTLLIGRSHAADIVIAEAGVAARHAELVLTDDGRHHLTDCASGAGTWRRPAATGAEGAWRPLRQGFVRLDDDVRFGGHRCTVADLLATAGAAAPSEGGEAPGQDHHHRPRGPVERDPVTGEIVRRRT